MRRTFSHCFQEDEKALEEESVPQEETQDNQTQSSQQPSSETPVNRAAELIKKQMTEIDKEINRRVQNQNMKTVRNENRQVSACSL